MADNTKQEKKELKVAYIEDARILAEQVLTEGLLSGSITFPYIGPKGENQKNPPVYTVPFMLENNLSFSLGNQWTTLVPEGISDILDSFANMASLADLSSGAQVKLISRAMNVATWKGSEMPKFQMPVTFVATRRSYNPVNIIEALAGTALPLSLSDFPNHTAQKIKTTGSNWVKKGAEIPKGIKAKLNEAEINWLDSVLDGLEKGLTNMGDAIKSMGLLAPLLYEPTIDYKTDSVSFAKDCTVSLQIGRWFRADKLVVESIGNIEFSKEIIAPEPEWLYKDSGNALYHKNFTDRSKNGWGFPLYAKCTLTLRPVTCLTYEDFLRYFLTGQNTNEFIASNTSINTKNKTEVDPRIEDISPATSSQLNIFNDHYSNFT